MSVSRRTLKKWTIVGAAVVLVMALGPAAKAETSDFLRDENGMWDHDEQVYRAFEQWVNAPGRDPIASRIQPQRSTGEIAPAQPVAVPLPPAVWSGMFTLAAGVGAAALRRFRRHH